VKEIIFTILFLNNAIDDQTA